MIISDDGADLPIFEQEYDKYDDEPFNDSPEPDYSPNWVDIFNEHKESPMPSDLEPF